MAPTRTAPPRQDRSQRDQIAAITGLRAVAALAILLFHVAVMTSFVHEGGVLGALLARLDLAVSIFFALSGLLLFRPWARSVVLGRAAPSTASYLWRRALRILPAYWVVLVVAMTTLAEPGGYSVKEWLEMIFLVHIYDPAAQWPNGGLGPTALGQIWSLAVEVAFYLVLPLLAALLGRFAARRARVAGGDLPEGDPGGGVDARARALLIALGALSCGSFVFVIFMHYPERVFWIGFLLPHYFVFFAVGMAIAVLLAWSEGDSRGALRARTLRRTIAGSAGTCLLTAGLAYAILMTPLVGRFGDPYTTLLQEEVRLLLHALITFFVLAPVACQERSGTRLSRALGGGLMTHLGKISYGIFLWQFVALEAVYRLTDTPYFNGGFWYVLPLSLISTVLLATLTYLLVERPLTRLRELRSPAPAAGTAAAAPALPVSPVAASVEASPAVAARPTPAGPVVAESRQEQEPPSDAGPRSDPTPSSDPMPRPEPAPDPDPSSRSEPAPGPARRTERAGRRAPVARAADHVTALDGVRAVAAFTVLVYHVGAKTGLTEGWEAWPVSRGDVGVAIFFVLSGLLLYRPWAQAALAGSAGPDTRGYLWRRAFRILPAYWLVAAIALLLFNAQHSASQWFWAKWLLLLQIYDVDSWWRNSEGRGLEQMWSLSVEVAFYIALPFLAAALAWIAGRGTPDVTTRAIRLLTALAALMVLSIGVVLLAHQPSALPELNMVLPRYLLWFCPGMALAVLSVWARHEEAEGVRRFCAGVAAMPVLSWGAAALAFAIASTSLTGPLHLGALPAQEGTIKAVLWAVVGVFLVAPSAFAPNLGGLVNLVFSSPIMRYLGRISYGIFLWQFVVIYGYYLLTGNETYAGGEFWTVLGIATAGTIVLAALTYHLIEDPFHRLGRYLGRPATRPAAHPTESAGDAPTGGTPHDEPKPDPAPEGRSVPQVSAGH